MVDSLSEEDREYFKLLRGATSFQKALWSDIVNLKTGVHRMHVRVEEGRITKVNVLSDEEVDLGLS